MIDIFKYDNYRLFLKDYFQYKKETTKSFSIRNFARKVDISSNSFISKVIQGTRNISEDTIGRFATAMDLKGKKELYFRHLVYYTQEKEPLKKDKFYEELIKLKSNTKYQKMQESQYKYFSEWYYPVIRHLAVNVEWNEDFAVLAKLVDPPIKPSDAKNAIKDLLECGLLLKEEDEYKLNANFLLTEGIPAYYKRQGRRKVLEKGIRAADVQAPTKRYTTFYTMAVTKENYDKIIGCYEQFEKQMLEIMAGDYSPEKIYQVIFQAFPLSKDFPEKESDQDE